jgi:murein DD-endopeptidase MepM/ murein hydrolase activator NlpD
MKKKCFSKAVISAISFILISLPVSVGVAANSDELKFAIDQKARQLDEITKQLQEAQISLVDTQVRGKTLKQEVARIDSTVQKVSLDIKASEITIDKLGLEIESTQQEINQKEQSIKLKQETIAHLLQEYRQKSGDSLLMMFMANKSLAETLAQTQSIDDFNAGLLNEVGEIRTIKKQLASRLDDVSDKKESVQKKKEQLRTQKSINEDQLIERQRLLTETKNKEATYQKVVSELEKQQQAISDEIDAIEGKLRDDYGVSNLPLKRPGLLSSPIPSAVMTQAYGRKPDACRLYKKTCFHGGVDYGVPTGTPMYAAYDGTVFAAGNNGKLQYGRYVVIKHDNGLSTLYAHMSRQSVQAGNSVKRGDLIGYSGRTGYAFGAHLHFGVYLSSTVQLKAIAGAGLVPIGVTVDPRDYM